MTGDLTPEAFDAHFRAQDRSRLLPELWASAWGEDYPGEVEPFSPCTWGLLGALVASLRARVDSIVVDVGCGRGGPGLWLARATGARLIGVDWSAEAVAIAGRRAGAWLPDGRAVFRIGQFTATGLPDGHADAVVSIDALALSMEPRAALQEVKRLLVLGGRLAFTATESAAAAPHEYVWPGLVMDAGMIVDDVLPIAGVPEGLGRLYTLIREHETELRADLGETATDVLLGEAATVGPLLDELMWVLVVAHNG